MSKTDICSGTDVCYFGVGRNEGDFIYLQKNSKKEGYRVKFFDQFLGEIKKNSKLMKERPKAERMQKYDFVTVKFDEVESVGRICKNGETPGLRR